MKNSFQKFSLLAIAFVLISSACWAQAPLTLLDNLVFYMRLNGGLSDASLHLPMATMTGSWTTDRNGNANRAVQLNGVSSQTITLANNSLVRPSLPMTVAFDALFTSFGCTAFANDFTSTNYTGTWVGIDATGHLHVNYGDGGSAIPSHRQSKSASHLITTNTWHSFVCVIRGANDMDIYIDCVLDSNATYSGTGGALFYGGNAGQFGVAATTSGASYMTGKLDQLAFWSRALTAGDVAKWCHGNLDQLLRDPSQQRLMMDLLLYPNPVSDIIKLRIPGAQGESLVLQILDDRGKVVRTMDVFGQTEYQIDVHDLYVGTYYLKVNMECQDPITQRFMVSR